MNFYQFNRACDVAEEFGLNNDEAIDLVSRLIEVFGLMPTENSLEEAFEECLDIIGAEFIPGLF